MERRVEVATGQPQPLGATLDGDGVNFAVFSSVAERVELCLFDDGGHEVRVDLPEVTASCWHGHVPGVRAGQRYGFRAHGRFAPGEGLLTNRHRLLLDPRALAVTGGFDVPGYFDAPGVDVPGDETPRDESLRDTAPFVPRSVVVDPGFDWGDDRPARTPWTDTVVYELHVKGFTSRHPDIPPELRGTYAGLASPPALEHLTGLGVTAVELMPVHHFLTEPALARRGRVNYWGYNPVAWFAPHGPYSSAGDRGAQVGEFKHMVRRLHEAGLEVIVDVVLNHTAEGGAPGPTLSLKGLDNRASYRLAPDDPATYVDVTGTGNSVDATHPRTLQLLMDSLRYWVQDLHVDGFRFDLATTLARAPLLFDPASAFLVAVLQDPVLNQVKLIAEPWDVGEGGYQLGRFPEIWSEWNDRFRDGVRDFWRGRGPGLGELATRLTASADVFAAGRGPSASVNFVTAHDGFTLADLVSYDHKHNEANGEDNRDGADENRSWNCGAEGPTDDEAVLALRRRQQRNLLATLLVSQGVPMLLSGDEVGRTQQGNNNAYCQDDEVSWFPWHDQDQDRELLGFTRQLIELRKGSPGLRRSRWLVDGDVRWLHPDGGAMAVEHWASELRAMAVVLEPLAILVNGHDHPVVFTLPEGEWHPVLDTTADGVGDPGVALGVREARSLTVLRRRSTPG